MNRAWKCSPSMPGRQGGLTLIEMLVAGVVSVIAVSAMLILMSNTLGTATQTIELTRMTDELRTGMQIVSREMRRANYHADFLQCYGNVDCRDAIQTTDADDNPITVNISNFINEINITDNGTSDCVWFWYDRPAAGMVTGEYVAAFRRDTDADGVGSLQMTTSLTGAPNCNLDTNWVDITDPNLVDVLTFDVTDANSVCEDIGTSGNSQVVERIQLTVSARPVFNSSVTPWLQGQFTGANSAIRELTEFIYVRNNFTDDTACS